MLGMLLPKGLISYSVMPGVMIRLNSLLFQGFRYIPYFIALVYSIVRLLPAGHPYLNPANIGRYGIRHVIAAAANSLVLNIRNIDQILLFIVVLLGLIMLFVQIAILGISLVFYPAMAMTNWNDFFLVGPTPAGTTNPQRAQDLAYILLDLVFGVPYPSIGVGGGFFESCVGLAVPCQNSFGLGITDTTTVLGVAVDSTLGPLSSGMFTLFPFPYHDGLHKLFAVYSQGILVVAVMVGLYFTITVIAETAQSGVPFGRRYNKIWAPIRIVVAFGLLVPLTVGLNSSQYLVLSAAKYGSAFATNGWARFNTDLTVNYLGVAQRLISTPNSPEIGAFTQFMFTSRVCAYAYDYIGVYTGPASPGPELMETSAGLMGAYVLGAQLKTGGNTHLITPATTYNDVINFIEPNANVVTIRFGVKNQVSYPKERGFVFPYCGEIRINLADSRDPASPNPPEVGPLSLQSFYLNYVKLMWFDAGPFLTGLNATQQTATTNNRAINVACTNINHDPCPAAHSQALDIDFRNDVTNQTQADVKIAIDAAVLLQMASTAWLGAWTGAADPLYNKGWAAAGIWYNKIAEMNGAMSMSVYNVPSASLYPHVMEKVRAIKAQYNQDTPNADRFDPDVSGIKDMTTLLGLANGKILAKTMHEGYKGWSGPALATSTVTKPTGNAFTDAISSLLGTNGLYDMRRNTDTHPLAQLVGVGRSLVESSIRSLGYATIAGLAGAGLGQLDAFVGKLGNTAASFFVTVAMLGLTVGFVLFYVVPFLPFIYFFFAVGGWIKGIFEAMVGVPLWALAHIRIDGEGLPGNAALNGYFLIFEVFLRPILIIFGLLASISIFSALVKVLNDIFTIVTENTAGYDIEAEVTAIGASTIDKMRGPIDRFFFTVIYAIIVYMIGMSSFKLIDQIPNNILRWMGQSIATFNDQREDAAQGLVGKASVGSQQTLSKIGGGLGGLVSLGGK